MNFSAWSIRNPVAPLLAFVLLMVLGYQSFYALPITRFPNIDFPLVLVSASQPGAAPAEMESQVTKEIEDAVAGLTGAKRVTSTVTDGVSTTVVEFRMEVPTDKAVQETKDAIDQIREGKIFTPPGFVKGSEGSAKDDTLRRLSSLTNQQARILNLICEGKLNKQIAFDLTIAETTVKAHVTAIMRKLGVQSRTQAVLVAHEANFSEVLPNWE